VKRTQPLSGRAVLINIKGEGEKKSGKKITGRNKLRSRKKKTPITEKNCRRRSRGERTKRAKKVQKEK